jgi:hypothetical protein
MRTTEASSSSFDTYAPMSVYAARLVVLSASV